MRLQEKCNDIRLCWRWFGHYGTPVHWTAQHMKRQDGIWFCHYANGVAADYTCTTVSFLSPQPAIKPNDTFWDFTFFVFSMFASTSFSPRSRLDCCSITYHLCALPADRWKTTRCRLRVKICIREGETEGKCWFCSSSISTRTTSDFRGHLDESTNAHKLLFYAHTVYGYYCIAHVACRCFTYSQELLFANAPVGSRNDSDSASISHIIIFLQFSCICFFVFHRFLFDSNLRILASSLWAWRNLQVTCSMLANKTEKKNSEGRKKYVFRQSTCLLSG